MGNLIINLIALTDSDQDGSEDALAHQLPSVAAAVTTAGKY